MNRTSAHLKNGGYVVIILTLLFAALGLAFVLGGAAPVIAHYSAMQGYGYSRQAYLAANSATGEVLYRLGGGKNLPNSVTVSLSTGSATITTTAVPGGKKVNIAGSQGQFHRNVEIDLTYGEGIAFHYGIQAGQGGFVLENSSSVIGNVFSNGTVTGSGNTIYGDVISAGPNGLISGVHATGTAYAHVIQNSTIDKDAHYYSISGSTVRGTSYPNSADQASTSLPISDEQIAEWEDWADDGGTATCTNGTYTITSSMSLGPRKIPCDLFIKGNGIVVTLEGPVWVAGNITTQNGPVIRMSANLGNENVALIADDPSNRSGGGIISIGQNTDFQGNGNPGSWVFTISQNNSAETGGSVVALDMGQSAGALVAYAGHGRIDLGQSVNVKEVTAYKIVLSNTAAVSYDTGLASSLFKAGPGGGYNILNWYEY